MLRRNSWTNQIFCRTILYMSLLQSRDRQKAHQFQGESNAQMILQMLNGAPPQGRERIVANARSRFLQLLADMKMLLGMIGPKWDGTLTDEISDQFQKVNEKLSKYPGITIFYPTKANDIQRDDGRSWETGEAVWGARPVPESQAVYAAIKLAEQNLLDRLKVCECGNWYFARFSHQKFCTSQCRVEFAESSEVRKEQKRERARQNYLYKKAHPQRGRRRK